MVGDLMPSTSMMRAAMGLPDEGSTTGTSCPISPSSVKPGGT